MKKLSRLGLFLVMMGCESSPPTFDGITLSGKIIDDGGAVYDNVEVSLKNDQGATIQTTISGGGGFYEFVNLGAGNYTVHLDVVNQPEGEIPAEQPAPLTITVKPDLNIEGVTDFVLVSTLSSMERLRRKYQADFDRWETENGEAANKEAVVFAGSSTIRLWSSLAADFPQIRTVNRGFGGSTAGELRQVTELNVAINPTAIILYEGDNDLAQDGASVQVFLDHMRAITEAYSFSIRKDRILILSIKPSRARWNRWGIFQEANAGLKNIADEKGYTFVDVSTPMLTDGKVNDLYMGNDGLHMSAEGYALWKSIIEPILMRVISR